MAVAINLRHLDVLRACLALLVLIGHARMLLWLPWQEWKALPHETWEAIIALAFAPFRYGHEAVMVFFVLSGFFIHLRAANGVEQFETGGYLRRRARRILPPYYAALLFTVLVDAAGRHFWPALYEARTGDAMLDGNFKDAGYSLASVLPALVAQPSLLSIRFGGNAPLWSIAAEVFYYALYPVFMLLWQRRRWLGYALGTAVSLPCWFLPYAGWWSGTLSAYPVWLAGALLADVMTRSPGLASSRVWFFSNLLLAVAGFGILHLDVTHAHKVGSLLFGWGMVVAFLSFPANLVRWRAGQLLEWLGIRSYSIYIFHYPVLVLISSWCFTTYGERPQHGWLAAASALVSLAAGLAGFHLVERRFLPRRKQA